MANCASVDLHESEIRYNLKNMATRKRKSRRKSKKQNRFVEAFSVVLFLIVVSLAFLYFSGVRPKPAIETAVSSISEIIQAVEGSIPVEEHIPSPTSLRSELCDESDKEAYWEDLPLGLQIPMCPAVKAYESSKTVVGHEIQRYAGFTLCYREDYELPEWVAYCITKSELAKEASRSNDFHFDTKISTGSADPSDYTRSGFDRGHIAPAADMAFSAQAMHDSFSMSNMTPQTPALNRGIWKNLEEQVRKWVSSFGAIYVIAGPVLDKKPSELKAIGKNAVSVPEEFYKVLLTKSGDSVIAVAFIFPNDKPKGSIWDYAVSVDEAEARTGLDFFYLLDDVREKSAEKTFSPLDWN